MPISTYPPGSRIGPPGICIYGRPGTGKTTLVGTMPGNGFLIDTKDIEGGNFVLEDKADRITVTDLERWDEIDDIFWALKKQDRKQLPNVDFDKLKWVCIDSITGMQKLAIRKVVKERDLDVDPADVSLRDWGKVGQMVGELVYRFRTLPYATIFTAQERKFGGGDNDEPIRLGPSVSPGALDSLVTSLMLIGRLQVTSESKRLLRVGPHDLYVTKCRAKPGRQMPSVVSDPNLEVMLKYLLGKGPRPKEAKESALLFE